MQNVTWPIYKRILQRSNRPILVGPFKSEVGFEALYWIPFVQSLGIAPDRLIPITRGGAAVWYNTPSGIELYDLRDPKDVRIENGIQHKLTGLLKQVRMTPFDRDIIKDAAKTIGITKYHVLHPMWMYHDLEAFWQGKRGLEWILPKLTHATEQDGKSFRQLSLLRAAKLPDLTLPANYCAARFYDRATFPYHEHSINLVRECLTQIAASQPVILLNSGVHADEHKDIPVKDIPNVFKLDQFITGITPQNNLAVQSAILSGATGFVGTYGGVAQLALRLGKPSVSFYWDWTGTALAHRHLSECIGLQTGVSFLTLRVLDIPLLKAVAPNLFVANGSSRFQQQPAKEPAPEISTHVEATLG